jgi:hypothetical protein
MPLPGQFDKPVFPVSTILLHFWDCARILGKIIIGGKVRENSPDFLLRNTPTKQGI